ncbi:MAG: putative DNA binding domain-containing protein [Actinomycetota bacterium]|nr:putative DNA binding domain-containing protein [Actinomycetota bacterium]
MVELLELLEPSAVLLEARALVESQWFDRKSARVTPRVLAETLVAFANAEGGLVVIGMHDGAPADAGADNRATNGWRQAGIDFARPPVRTDIRTLAWADGVTGRTGSFVLVDVPASESVHATAKDEVFLRVGDENRRLSFGQRKELLFDKGQAQYDQTTPFDVEADQLQHRAVDAYLREIGASDPNRVLVARGLADRSGVATVAGLLVFGDAPETWFPSAHLRVIRYRGSERGSGSRLQVLHDERIEGRIPDQVRHAVDLVDGLVPNRQALRADGLFGRVPLIPRDAWLEGIVNAAVHRSYSNFGDHTRIEIFDDRIEIESPGRFPGLVDPGDPLRITRFARNPHIARACAELGLGREFGEGIRRMFDEMRLAGLGDPEYYQTAGSVRLVLPTDPVERALEARLPLEAREIARLLRDAGRLGTGEIVEATGRSRPWVLGRLRQLEEAEMIERVGKGPSDPRAYWKLRVD